MVPAMYANHLLGRSGIGFIGIQALILLPIWAVALAAAVARRDGGLLRGERPLRIWRTLIGAPLLLVLAWDAVFAWQYGAWVLWPVVLLTFLSLVVVGLRAAQGPGQATTAQPT